jgi:hypothetical protein
MRYFASLLPLLGLIGACSTVPEPGYKPPVELLQDCPEPVVSVQHNSGLVQGLQAYQQALRDCNKDKARLRALLDG